MTRHGHIHHAIGRGIDTARWAVLAAIGILGGYSINEFQLLVIGDYSHTVRLCIFLVLFVALYLLLTPLVSVLHAAQTWFDELEIHAHDQPDDVGIGTRALLWSFRAPPLHDPLPLNDEADEEKATLAFSMTEAMLNGKLHVSSTTAPRPVLYTTSPPPLRSATGAIVRPLKGFP